MRDNQRQRVYNAEREVNHFYFRQGGEHLETVPIMQAYLDKLMRSAWFKKNYPGPWEIEVRDGRGRRNACASKVYGYEYRIKMPLWSRSEMILLHELAHCLTNGHRHGRVFCYHYIALVERQMGKDKAEELRAAFRRHNVDWGTHV